MSQICFTLTRRFAIRILSVLLILLFLLLVTISPIVTAKAFAATLTVVGTVALTMATIASIYMICAGASGIDGAVRNQARATGTQPLDYMGQLLNRWLSATGVLPATLATKFQQGFSYLPDGTLFLDNDCTEAVADFQRWAWSVEGADLVDYAPLGEGNYWHYNGLNIELVELTETRVFSGTTYYLSKWLCKATPLPIYYFIASSNGGARYWTCAIRNLVIFAPYNEYAARYATRTYDTGNSYSLGSSYSLREGTWQQFMGGSLTGVNVVENAAINSTDDMPSPDEFTLEPVVIGNPETFYGPAQQEQGTQIAAGSSVTVSPEAAANLHIANYLRAMAAAYAGTGVADVPVTDTGTGEEETLPLSVPLDTPLTVTGISDSAIDQSGSVAVSDSVASDFTGLDDYTMDLTRFFPFCIPFDLAALFQKFEAEAAAPVVDIPFPNPADPEGTPLSVHVDLTPFDELASVVRKLELVAFVIGLCFLTKRLIQGGD